MSLRRTCVAFFFFFFASREAGRDWRRMRE
jgi:hypothetical protein